MHFTDEDRRERRETFQRVLIAAGRRPALAGLRSKHNTYMSVPLLLFMVSVDQGAITGAEQPVIWIAATLAIGWVMTFLIYRKVPSVKGF